ncbi:CPBP family glutamic-type intramembrane protease [Desulfoluna spongiiphila]|uniref:CAAX prenyl protease 2/Lysostaphin resistance protein A-like domain-containing protein n=1 Tax=Desulfoluna spongiiphila TaxID=419481 RepID=A0A1G5BZS2_9BACT|nr:CPBP family glutamic-type intramembrane protease [Desulfoluna spongiiphila]SCX95628.1 hypothetical protein SAMN05216233_102285 [Desulfoluna spongiiphila]
MEKPEMGAMSPLDISNRTLLILYLSPYALYVLIPMVTDSPTLGYALRLGLVPLALALTWKNILPLTGPRPVGSSLLWGGLTGVIGCVLWVCLAKPFEPQGSHTPWSPLAFWLRFAAASLVVPLFEELLIRGYLFRLILQWQQAQKKGSHSPLSEALDECDVRSVEPGAWSSAAIFLSSALFAMGHRLFEWPAAMVYGVLLSMLWVVRKDMVALISAHAVTNACLATYIRHTGQWALW